MSILQPGVSSSEIKESLLKPFGVTGEALDVVGQQLVSFTLGGQRQNHSFLVCPLPSETAGLLGMDFFEKFGAEISFKDRILTWSGKPEALRVRPGTRVRHTAFTVFTRDKAGHSPRSKQPEESSLNNNSTRGT